MEKDVEVKGRITLADSDSIIPVRVTLIQKERAYATSTDSVGRYTIKGIVDLDQPFVLAYAAEGFLTKTIVLNYNGIRDGNLPPGKYRPIETLDIEMYKLHPLKERTQVCVALFSWDSTRWATKFHSEHTQFIKKYTLKYYPIHGDTTLFEKDTNGIVMEKIPIVKGEIHGTIETYRTDGSLHTSTVCINGIRQGTSVTYDQSGRKRLELEYENNQIATKKQYDYKAETGELNGVQTFYSTVIPIP